MYISVSKSHLTCLKPYYYFKNIGTAKKCKKINHPQVSYTSAQEVFIENADGLALTIDMDGEFIGYAPVEFTCLQEKLRFLK